MAVVISIGTLNLFSAVVISEGEVNVMNKRLAKMKMATLVQMPRVKTKDSTLTCANGPKEPILGINQPK